MHYKSLQVLQYDFVTRFKTSNSEGNYCLKLFSHSFSPRVSVVSLSATAICKQYLIKVCGLLYTQRLDRFQGTSRWRGFDTFSSKTPTSRTK